MTTMGEVLRCFRMTQENLLLKKLAEALGMSQSYVSQLESGKKKMSNENLEKISKFYNVPKSQFYRIFEDANEKNYDHSKLMLDVLETWMKYNKDNL